MKGKLMIFTIMRGKLMIFTDNKRKIDDIYG